MEESLFTEENISRLFGSEAAEDESIDRLKEYYFKNKTHEKVTADLPLRILVGHKGIGKSAIFTIARHEDEENNRLAVLIRPDDIAGIVSDKNDFIQLITEWKEGLLKIIFDKIFDRLEIPQDESFQYTLMAKSGKVLNFLCKTFQKK